MRKTFVALLALVLFASTHAWAASDADIRAIVEKSIAKGASAGTISKVVDVYGGKGVISSKDALWWVKDGKVYAVNGSALSLSSAAPKAPPSVTAGKIHSAAEGTAFPLPANLGVTAEELPARVGSMLKQVADQGEPFKSAVFKKETYFDYNLSTGKNTAAQFSFKEVGGMVTAITMSGYAESKASAKDSKTPLTSALSIILMQTVMSDKETRKPFVETMLKNKNGWTKTSGNITMTFKRSDGMLEMSLFPASGEQKTTDKGQKNTAHFKLTPKKFVDNYNKAASGAKADQRARIGQSNDKSTQILASKNNGALLTTNAAGNVTSVVHIGTGDGTPESGANIMLGMGFAIAGIKPDWTPKQRLDVLKKLGFGTADTLPEKSSTTVGGVLFEFRVNQETGVWLIMTPQDKL